MQEQTEPDTSESAAAAEPKAEPRRRCPHNGRYGEPNHFVASDGICYTCAGEEAARRARLEERGIFLG